jgi:hypothetical protein
MKSGVFKNNFSHVYIHDSERNIISIKSPQIASLSNEVLGQIPHASLLESAVTNARFASLRGLPVVPAPLSTTPAPLLKPRARHELAWCRAAGAVGFRLRLGGGRCAPAAIR